MRVKTNKRMMALILLTTVLLCVVVVIGSQVAVFGVGQASPSGLKADEPQAASTSGKPMKDDGTIMVSERLSKRLIHKVDPIYPELAIKDQVQGKVILQINVNEEGLVSDVRITAGHSLLNDAAITAVKQWKFIPSLIGGSTAPGAGKPAPPPPEPVPGMAVKGVPFTTTITIDFRLNKDKSPKIIISGS